MAISDPIAHPLVEAAAAMRVALDEVAAGGVDPLYLTMPQKGALLRELTALSARVTALRADVLAVADDLADQTADRSPGTWLAAETGTDRREAVRDERLGVALRQRWPHVGRAVRAGRITWQQAEVAVQALDALPETLDDDLVRKAEAHLLAEASRFGPRHLRRLGRKVLEVVAPEVADHHEFLLLLAEEHRARAATRLSFRPRGDGTTDLHARLPDPVANRLKAYLEAWSSPRRASLDSEVGQLPLPRRRGEAFCALLEHVPRTGLPRHGGTPTQVLVMIDYDTLCGQLVEAGAASGVAETSTGDTITAGEARRLACTAGILPVVLGGRSEPLDLGRSSRLFKNAVRTALDARDRECRAEGCDIPAAWCEAHHRQPWTPDGHTSVENGLLLCSFHHHRAHDPAYAQTRVPNGDLRFHRRM